VAMKKNIFSVGFFLLLSGLVFLFMSAAIVMKGKNDPSLSESSFSELLHRIFLQEVTSDTLNLHYSLTDPKAFGITSYPLRLPCYDKEEMAASHALTENLLLLFENYSPDQLSLREQHTKELVETSLSLQKDGIPYTYYEDCFSPSSGIQSQYPILMAEYRLRSKKDVEEYLALLSQTGEYLDSYLLYYQEKAAAGLCPPDTSLLKVISQCDSLISREELYHGTHFLQKTFQERLLNLQQQGILSAEEAVLAQKENTAVLLEHVAPAYQRLENGLYLLLGKGSNTEGLVFYPQGKEYYRWLVEKNTGSSKTPEEMAARLEKNYYELQSEMAILLRKLQDVLPEADNTKEALLLALSDTGSFPLSDPEEMLQHLKECQTADFPTLESLSKTPVEATVKSVSPSLEPFTSPAFYFTPAIDDARENSIYINHQSTPAGIDLYTTLGHEGYPGHLYQSVYRQLYSSDQDLSPFHSLLYYGGFVEGWAIYCELISFSYAASLYPEEQQSLMSLVYDIVACDRKQQLCLLSYLDLKLHYYGISYEDAAALLEEYGISSREACREVYEYILEEPANYVKYYIGYLEILELKEKAELLMNSAYSDYKFHTFLLETGPADFAYLNRRLEEACARENQTNR